MSGGTRPCNEAPIFTGLTETSFTYAFELHFGNWRTDGAGSRSFVREDAHRAGFRLRQISEALDGLKTTDAPLYQRLIDPVRSFLDDVTTGSPGTNGRPLLFAASAAEPDAASRRVWVVRPESWTYEYESLTTRLYVPGERLLPFRMRDTFCVFESGRIFYLITLTQDAMEAAETQEVAWPDPDAVAGPAHPARKGSDLTEPASASLPAPIDEYAVLQFQQLVMDRNRRAGEAGYLGFVHAAAEPAIAAIDSGAMPVCSLIDLADRRLDTLIEEARAGRANGVSAILSRYDILPLDAATGRPLAREPLSRHSLRRLCVALESDVLLRVSELTHCLYDPRARPEPETRPGHTPPAKPDIAGMDADWSRAHGVPPPPGARRPHADPDICRAAPTDGAAPTQLYDRSALAFAGLAQGVPDFPWQDESEIFDSTRPAYFSVESSHYVHPRFVLEVAKSWRSYQQARPEIGTCPYLLLMFMVALHDELIVDDIENQVDHMVYADGPSRSPGQWLRRAAPTASRYRAVPLLSVLRVLDGARKLGGSGVHILERNLSCRFELFRWSSIQRSGNIFRYAKERGALTAIQDAMGTNARFERAHANVDRMESLVEDVSALKATYAAQRTNWLLFVLTLVSVMTLPKGFAELLLLTKITTVNQSPQYLWVLGALATLLGGWFVFNLWYGSRGRRAARTPPERSFPATEREDRGDVPR
ncbi:hypothetical protein [Sphingomonas sp.]|uniref:hypothetical protein n=1 Tax=Sphingomonas sp. TaxID=28214 RepID=UPI001EBD5B81|nr:hypothetical protein [Sphingomonas sp.]MBX3595470.1 hypothetical protein [Sphingomonas sp.]